VTVTPVWLPNRTDTGLVPQFELQQSVKSGPATRRLYILRSAILWLDHMLTRHIHPQIRRRTVEFCELQVIVIAVLAACSLNGI